MGLAVPVEVSHNKVVVVPGIGRSARAWIPTSAACACAMLSRSFGVWILG